MIALFEFVFEGAVAVLGQVNWREVNPPWKRWALLVGILLGFLAVGLAGWALFKALFS